MKSLNENWFALTLVAVIFGILGFLLGRTTGHHGACGPRGPHGMMMMGGECGPKGPHMMKLGEEGAWFMREGAEVLEDMDIDVVKGEDGNITVTVDADNEGGEVKDAKVRVIKIQKDEE
jgi:hypothetical protein